MRSAERPFTGLFPGPGRTYQIARVEGNVLPLTPYLIDRFTGLNLQDSNFAVGAEGSTDAINVDFTRPGVVRSRDGYETLSTLTSTSVEGFAVFENTAGLRQYIVGYTNAGVKKIEAYSSNGGALVAAAAAPTGTAIDAVRFGSPTTQYLYVANGADTVWRWDGAAWTKPAGMPTAAYLTLMPRSNRLVAGYGNTLEFSDALAPETYSGNTVGLTPGDESVLTGLATWQNYVFAFKDRRFFVVTNERTSGTGGVIFDYDTVDGYGAIVQPVAGNEGVYFFDGQSVWLTTGGAPQRVSRPVERFIAGRAGIDFFLNGYIVDQTSLTGARLSYAGGRLYLALLTNGGGFMTLVFEPQMNAWTAYSTKLRYAFDLRKVSFENRSVYWLSSDGKVNRFNNASPTDAGASFTWGFSSGYYDMGSPGQEKVIQETRVWGTGTTTLRMEGDPTNLDAGDSMVLTTAGTYQLIDRDGTLFRHWFSGTANGTDNPVEIHRIVHYISGYKPVGLE